MHRSHSQKISRAVDQLWKLRFNHQIETCYQKLSNLKSLLGLKVGRPIPERVQEWLELSPALSGFSELAGDVLLMHSSLARLEGNNEYAHTLLSGLFDQLRTRNLKPSGYFYIELGVQAFTQGDYGKALESFIVASAKIKAPVPLFISKFNVLLCLENLNLPLDQQWKETKILARHCRLKHVEQLLHHFELRRKIRRGEFDEAFRFTNQKSTPTQAIYFMNWVEQLPFHSFTKFQSRSSSELKKWLGEASPSSPLYLRTFRARTLYGLPHEDVRVEAKVSEFVDRAYLWTWRSLCGDSEISARKLALTLKGINLKSQRPRMTFEDLVFTQNILLWLGLFCDVEESVLERKILELNCPEIPEAYAVFEFERFMIRYFLALKRGARATAEDVFVLMQHHRIWKNRDLYFRDIVRAVKASRSELAPVPVRGLVAAILDSLSGDPQASNAKTIVDLRGHFIEDTSKGIRAYSLPLCRAYSLLRNSNNIAADIFLNETFSLPHYDPIIHDSKIYNLLTRMKKTTPSLKFHLKRGIVTTSGSWQGIGFRKPSAWYEALRNEKAWKDFLSRKNTLPNLNPFPVSQNYRLVITFI